MGSGQSSSNSYYADLVAVNEENERRRNEAVRIERERNEAIRLENIRIQRENEAKEVRQKVNKAVESSPSSIANHNQNTLADFVTNAGASSDTTCLQLVYQRFGEDISKYCQKVGSYNFNTRSNPSWIPQREEKYTDFSNSCPDGWVQTGTTGNEAQIPLCTSNSYNGVCNSGKKICKEVTKSKNKTTTIYRGKEGPSNFVSAKYNNNDKIDWSRYCGGNWTLKECPDGWSRYYLYGPWVSGPSGRRSLEFQRPTGGGLTAYVFYEAPYTKIVLSDNPRTGKGWYYTGPTKDFNVNNLDFYNKAPDFNYRLGDLGPNVCWNPYPRRCNATSYFNGYTDYAKFDWARQCRENWSYNDCPNGWTQNPDASCCNPQYKGPCLSCKDKYENLNSTEYYQENVCNTQEPYAVKKENDFKKNMEKQCGVKWPEKTRIIPGYYACNNGRSLQEDINQGLIYQIADVGLDVKTAWLISITNNTVMSPKYFAIHNGKLLIAKDGMDELFINKGGFQPNCPGNGGEVQLYKMNDEIFEAFNLCRNMNDRINTTNQNIEMFSNMKNWKDNYNFVFLIILVILFIILVKKYIK